MKKFFKYIAVALTCIIVTNCCMQDGLNVYAKSGRNVHKEVNYEERKSHKPKDTYAIHNIHNGESKNIYLDGKEINVSADENDTITVAADNDDFNAVLDVYSDGTAGIVIDKNNEQHEYVVQINELVVDTNKVDIKVFEDNEIVMQFNSLEDIQNYTYSGQIPIFIGWAVEAIISFLISALVVAGTISALHKVATVYNYDWYDGKDAAAAIKADSKLKEYCYPAFITNTAAKRVLMGTYNTYTYIAIYAGMELSKTKLIVVADNPIDIYSYSATSAAKVITNANFTIENPSSTEKGSTSGLQFPHYHKTGHSVGLNQFHSLCGSGTLIK